MQSTTSTPDQPTRFAAGRPPLQAGRASGDRQRALLLALVDADPGIHVLRAAHVLGMNWNTCYHHVRRLAAEGTIVVSKVRGRLCLFDRKDGAIARRIVGVLLRDQRTANIARVVVQSPGINQQAVADELGIAPSAAHRHLRRLQSAGLLERVRHAREVANHPTDLLRNAWLAIESGAGLPQLASPMDPGAAPLLGAAP